MTQSLSIIILAAGKGKRMNNPDIPKVMALLAEKPLLGHVLDSIEPLEPSFTVVVLGHHKEKVYEYLTQFSEQKTLKISAVVQEEQLGTGHAVAQAESTLQKVGGDILILSGDVPLISTRTIEHFIHEHKKNNATISVLSAHIPQPAGYGRIIRDSEKQFQRIVEHKDATEEEKSIHEINSGIYCVKADFLFTSLHKVSNSNAQGEYYLTDIVGILQQEGHNVYAVACEDYREILGINTSDELAAASELWDILHHH